MGNACHTIDKSLCPIKTVTTRQHQTHSRKSTIQPPPLKFRLVCDQELVIKEVDEFIGTYLNYQTDELIGKSITMLMSPTIRDLHNDLPKFKNMPQHCLDGLIQKLKYDMSKCIEYAVYDKMKKPHFCKININLDKQTFQSEVFITVINKKRQYDYNVPIEFQKYLHTEAEVHVEEYKHVICLMMDIAGSTQYAIENKGEAMAKLLHSMYNIVNNVITKHFFPLVYIHETVGDSILLIIDAPFMPRYPSRSATIAVQCASLIQQKVDNYLKECADYLFLRVAITEGCVTAGVIDGRCFRVFGPVVHLAQRLEAMANKNEITMSESFVHFWINQQGMLCKTDSVKNQVYCDNLIFDEHDNDEYSYIKQQTSPIKGFGLLEYYALNSYKYITHHYNKNKETKDTKENNEPGENNEDNEDINKHVRIPAGSRRLTLPMKIEDLTIINKRNSLRKSILIRNFFSDSDNDSSSHHNTDSPNSKSKRIKKHHRQSKSEIIISSYNNRLLLDRG